MPLALALGSLTDSLHQACDQRNARGEIVEFDILARVVRQATTSVKNLILAMNGEKPIAQVNPEVPVKKV